MVSKKHLICCFHLIHVFVQNKCQTSENKDKLLEAFLSTPTHALLITNFQTAHETEMTNYILSCMCAMNACMFMSVSGHIEQPEEPSLLGVLQPLNSSLALGYNPVVHRLLWQIAVMASLC